VKVGERKVIIVRIPRDSPSRILVKGNMDVKVERVSRGRA